MADDEVSTQMGRTSRATSVSSQRSMPDIMISRTSTINHHDILPGTPSNNESRVSSTDEEERIASTSKESRTSSSNDESGTLLKDTQDEIENIRENTIIIDESTESAPRIQSENTEITLMTETEIKDWDKRMGEMVERLQKQKDDYENWETSLNERRLLAFNRLQNLNQFHHKRLDLYNSVEKYIKDLKTDPKNSTDTEKSFVKD